MAKYCAHLHHTLAALQRYSPDSLVTLLPNSEQRNHPSSNLIYTKSTPNHIHHHYVPSVTLIHTTHIISSPAPTYAPHCHPWIYGRTEIYMRKKEEARREIGMVLHVHNEMLMKKICEGGNKIMDMGKVLVE